MKKIFISFLAVLFLFNAIGYQVLFAFLIIHNEQMVDNLPDIDSLESLETITVDSNNNRHFFMVNEKEFYFKGCLYDIKYKIVLDGKTIYRCWKDEKEYELIIQFFRIHDENNESGRKFPLSKFMQKVFQNLFVQKLKNTVYLFSSYQVYNITSSNFYNQPDLHKFTPPPQIFNS